MTKLNHLMMGCVALFFTALLVLFALALPAMSDTRLVYGCEVRDHPTVGNVFYFVNPECGIAAGFYGTPGFADTAVDDDNGGENGDNGNGNDNGNGADNGGGKGGHGNASGNNGRDGNYDNTGHSDNGRGRGRG